MTNLFNLPLIILGTIVHTNITPPTPVQQQVMEVKGSTNTPGGLLIPYDLSSLTNVPPMYMFIITPAVTNYFTNLVIGVQDGTNAPIKLGVMPLQIFKD